MDQLPRLGKRELIWLRLERFPLSFGAWDGLRYFILALPEPSILLFTVLAHLTRLCKVFKIVYIVFFFFRILYTV